MAQHSIWNREEEIRFEGAELGSASSHEPGRLRWLEIYIYKTKAGKYVAQRIGASRVYHTAGCSSSNAEPVAKLEDLELTESELRELIPCPICEPVLEDGIKVEDDRMTAEVADTASELVEKLNHRSVEGGVEVYRLPKVCRRALQQAAELDDEMHEAVAVQYIA